MTGNWKPNDKSVAYIAMAPINLNRIHCNESTHIFMQSLCCVNVVPHVHMDKVSGSVSGAEQNSRVLKLKLKFFYKVSFLSDRPVWECTNWFRPLPPSVRIHQWLQASPPSVGIHQWVQIFTFLGWKFIRWFSSPVPQHIHRKDSFNKLI